VRTRAIRGLCRGHYPEPDLETWAASPMPPRFGEVLVSQRALVAEEDELAVGFGFLDRDDHELAAVYVSPTHARRGVGRLLLAALEAEARAAGIPVLRLASSLNAIGFYQRNGYQLRGEHRFRHPEGFDLPCVWMDKELASPDLLARPPG
jgi:GNAT superfamily N-acetyltransferase